MYRDEDSPGGLSRTAEDSRGQTWSGPRTGQDNVSGTAEDRADWLSRWRDRRRTRRDKSLTSEDIPWWVNVFTNWGRPIVAVLVLVLCAPGEQHLAKLAGWNGRYEWLSWGMAGLFSLYAGIAAVVATKRPEGARGKRSAVAGAVISLALAMAAQPVSHLFVTGWFTAEPRAPWQLVVAVSVVPPFILGHLLHLAASPVSSGQDSGTGQRTAGQTTSLGRDTGTARVLGTRDIVQDSGQTLSPGQGIGTDLTPTVLTASGQTRTPEQDTGTDRVPAAPRTADSVLAAPVPEDKPGTRSVPEQRDTLAVSSVRTVAGGSMSSVALDILRDNPSITDENIKVALRERFGPDSKPNSLAKATSRARDKYEKEERNVA